MRRRGYALSYVLGRYALNTHPEPAAGTGLGPGA